MVQTLIMGTMKDMVYFVTITGSVAFIIGCLTILARDWNDHE